MSNFEPLDMQMTISDERTFIDKCGELAVTLLGPVSHHTLQNKCERLAANGSFSRLTRTSFLQGDCIEVSDIRGLRFLADMTVTDEAEAETLPSVEYEGECAEFYIDGQRKSLELIHSYGRLTVDALGEVNYEPLDFGTSQEDIHVFDSRPSLADTMLVLDIQRSFLNNQ